MAELFASTKLLKNRGGAASAANALAGKIVGVYFCAHWCPPCRLFTPKLRSFYEATSKEFEVVFVSLDNTLDEMKEYLDEAHGNWYYLEPHNPMVPELASHFANECIPQLTVIRPNGDVIEHDAVSSVCNIEPMELLAKWRNF